MPRPITDGIVPWPADDAARYRKLGYWQDRPVTDHIFDRVDQTPQAVAVIDGAVQLTYRDLAERADAAADRLTDLGLRAGDRVLVQLPNTWHFIAFTLACFRIGIVPVMALPAHRRHEMGYLAELSEATTLVVPGVVKDFDHEDMAAQIAAETPSVQHVLVLADAPRPGHLRSRCPLRAGHRPRCHPQTVGRSRTSRDRCRLLPAVRRDHRTTQADHPHPQRLRVQRATVRGDVRPRREQRVPGCLPVSHNFPLACPGVLGHVDRWRHRGHAGHSLPRQGIRGHRGRWSDPYRCSPSRRQPLARPPPGQPLQRPHHTESPSGRRLPPAE